MPVTTTSAAIHIAPVAIKTFFSHGKKKVKKKIGKSGSSESPQDDIFFDEAFHIVKSFIELGTKNTIESLQAFTNTHVPAPYWAAVSPVSVPLSMCNDAADLLVDWFGPEELKYVVGGERWWQVRGLDGVDCEWIAELEDIDQKREVKTDDGKPLSDEDANIKKMEGLETVMLYVHGGGYFWGSINTHRYQILHYSHKMHGRAFAVNYRKAPQYPWPCALQDVLSAYLYLIRPPANALHKAIPHSKIVFAGDSAGGGLCVTALTVLRDLGLPMPAGAVLISPWVDLTHSFPSVMENTATDIIPQHGFLAKPSTLWPIPTIPEPGGRIVPTVSNNPPDPGDVDTLKPSPSRIDRPEHNEGGVYGPGETIKTQGEMLDDRSRSDTPSEKADVSAGGTDKLEEALDSHNLDHWEPKPPKIFMENHNSQPLELRSQIQMYAANEQLTHPLVSPILQGSLGNLPPLYIIAGDSEVLRDEIIYLAHKAAHPSKYPTRQGVLHDSPRQKENATKFTTPTKVHLQIFDGMCHVLTVFMFTESARYAYRSIAEFTKHVTQNDQTHIFRNPFPELHKPTGLTGSLGVPHTEEPDRPSKKSTKGLHLFPSQPPVPKPTASPGSHIEMNLYLKNEQMAMLEVDRKLADVKSDSSLKEKSVEIKEKVDSTFTEDDIPGTVMIRERVDIHGNAHPMEPHSELKALQVDVSHIGILKEAPAQRWKVGQDLWDKRYAKRTKKVIKQQKANRAKAELLLKNAIDQGFVHQSHQSPDLSGKKQSSQDNIQKDRRWGPLDLEEENPPTTAIAARRDTLEAVALLKNSIYHAAPVTHLTIPKFKKIDTVRAAFDVNDNPNRPSKQYAAEEQVRATAGPMHGLRIWDDLVRYFGRKTTAKAMNGINAVSEKVGLKQENDE